MSLKKRFLQTAMCSKIPPNRFDLFQFFQILSEDLLGKVSFQRSHLKNLLFFSHFEKTFHSTLEKKLKENQSDFLLESVTASQIAFKSAPIIRKLFQRNLNSQFQKYEIKITEQGCDFDLRDFFRKKRFASFMTFYNENKQQIFALLLLFLFLLGSFVLWFRSLQGSHLSNWLHYWFSFFFGAS